MRLKRFAFFKSCLWQSTAALSFVISSLLTPAQASTPDALPASDGILRVKWDCYLPSSGIDCSELQRSYLSGLIGVEVVDDEKRASVVLQIRSIRRGDGVSEYQAFFLGIAPQPVLKATKTIAPNMSTAEAFRLFVAFLHQNTAPFLAIAAPAENANGTTFMVFKPLGGGGSAPGRDDDKSTRWYNSASLSGSVSSGDTSVTSANVSDTASWSDPTWQLQAKMSFNYQRIAIEIPNSAPVIADTMSFNGDTITSYTFAGHWSVAALLSIKRSPSANQRLTETGYAALEWNLVPFLKTNESTVIVRYGLGIENQNYISENLNGNMQETFLAHMLEVYVNWHFDRIDLSTGIYGSSIADQIRYSQMGCNVSATYRLTNDLSLTGSFNVNFRNEAIYQPANRSGNPLEQFLSGGNYSKISTSSSLTLSYTFGNSLLNSQDRRWK